MRAWPAKTILLHRLACAGIGLVVALGAVALGGLDAVARARSRRSQVGDDRIPI